MHLVCMTRSSRLNPCPLCPLPSPRHLVLIFQESEWEPTTPPDVQPMDVSHAENQADGTTLLDKRVEQTPPNAQKKNAVEEAEASWDVEMVEHKPGKEVATDTKVMSPLKNRAGIKKRKRITEVEKLEISGTKPKIARTEKGTVGVYARRKKAPVAQEEKAPTEKASPVADKKKARGKSSKQKKFKVPPRCQRIARKGREKPHQRRIRNFDRGQRGDHGNCSWGRGRGCRYPDGGKRGRGEIARQNNPVRMLLSEYHEQQQRRLPSL